MPRPKLWPILPAACLLLAAAVACRRRRRRRRAAPPLPDNPYHRFYTQNRRIEELAPRPGKPARSR